jgi:pimeloyl-ACP methyl ester carboxylesterase
VEREIVSFTGAEGVPLIADAAGETCAPPIILLHGGGQTRGSWRDSVDVLAGLGFRALAPDARGHGDSGKSPDGSYALELFAADLRAIVATRGSAPVLVGASLGGITSLLVAGEGGPAAARALVLVDVAVSTNPYGVKQIHNFMRANPAGFASLDEAADAVASYASDRPRPKNNEGLRRNLRLRDGRWFWHWDPMFLETFHASHVATRDRLVSAARSLRVPVLLVHAAHSNVVTKAEVAELRDLVPGLEYARVEGAGHMVVGDRNNTFNRVILDFLSRHDLPGESRAPTPNPRQELQT